MTHPSALGRRVLVALAAVALTAAGLAPAGPAGAAPDHSTLVRATPSTASPDIMDGTVDAIHDAGTKIIIRLGPSGRRSGWPRSG
ncbi:hypothetical protein ABZ071_07355 [Micromonospora fulviviridis]|uniref:Uncharacterized protein n=1 Tax=Micromonospora fulviviridis TaxID=47860 RepID=A0ABV2VG04_9ACTN